MASRPSFEAVRIEVTFARRPDGGLQAWCDKVPGFFLSHSDPAMVFADVEPALTVILEDMYGLPVEVRRVTDIGCESAPIMPAFLCGPREYVGVARGA